MSSPGKKTAPRAPSRERGRRRVAELLGAAAAVFAARGYDAATMTEVAARAGAPIGSLYQFFPSKEALADALMDRLGAQLLEALGAIEARAAALPLPDLVDALVDFKAGHREERAAAAVLIEGRREASARASGLGASIRRQVAGILRARIPALAPERAEVMSQVLIPLMKAAAEPAPGLDPAARAAVMDEIKHLILIYLADVGGRPDRAGPPP